MYGLRITEIKLIVFPNLKRRNETDIIVSKHVKTEYKVQGLGRDIWLTLPDGMAIFS